MAAHVAGIGQRAIAIATPIALAAYIFSPRSAEPMHAVTGADLLEREPLVAPSISLGQNAAMGALHNGHRFLTLNSDSKLHALGVELAISPEHLIVPEQCDARIKIPRSIEMHGEAHIAVEGAFEVFFQFASGKVW